MRPTAVLLDAGGVLVLPDPNRVIDAFARAECDVNAAVLVGAHYHAATRFSTDRDAEADWAACWLSYLQAYIEWCGVAEDEHEEAHRHVDSEFADAALWVDVVPGIRDGLRALASAGVRLGVVSNADGMMGQRLAQLEVCQVGPGIAVEVECVIDSGNVGIMKPDPRIFHAALEVMGIGPDEALYVGDMPAIDVVGARRAGLRPVLMDPLGLHHGADYDRTSSLVELAAWIERN